MPKRTFTQNSDSNVTLRASKAAFPQSGHTGPKRAEKPLSVLN